MEERLEVLDLTGVPDNPGCYLFSDESGRVIYIGKAKSLKKRVVSYFRKKGLDAKTERMVRDIRSLEFIVTDNEVEALILENTLIKKHTPKYNIVLKDAKSYAFIRMTDEEFPRLMIARMKDQGLKGEFFGPFVSAAARDYIMGVVNKTFKLRTCKRFRKKPCLRYHIDICGGPCIGEVTAGAYGETLKRVRLVLKGKAQDLVKSMSEEMKKYSGELNYEYALELRNQVNALKRLLEKQNMDRRKRYNEDIIHYQVRDGRVYLVFFNVYKGTLENRQAFQFMQWQDDFFEEFLVRYYSEGENVIPDELILPHEISESLVVYLKERSGKNVMVTVPQRGEKKQLLDLVYKNIEITFFGDMEKLKDLKSKLKMQELPVVIECFDISHISGQAMVASMVQFRQALPDKNNYRRYKIKTVEGIDDFAAIGEVVRRRYTRLKNEQSELPDLVLIDGGIGQLNAATAEIKKLDIAIPTISIAKRLEEIWISGVDEPLVLSRKSKALQLLQQVRDEAHRFAITYNRLLRKKQLLKQEKRGSPGKI